MRSVNDAAEIPPSLRLPTSLRGCKYISFVGKTPCLSRVPEEIDSERGQLSLEFSTPGSNEKSGIMGCKEKVISVSTFLKSNVFIMQRFEFYRRAILTNEIIEFQ